MDEITAAEAARVLPVILDRIERDGVPVRIVRRGRAVAELRPVRRSTVGHLRRHLRNHPPDAGYRDDIRFTRDLPARTPPA